MPGHGSPRDIPTREYVVEGAKSRVPWEPKAGTDPDFAAIEAEKARHVARMRRLERRWELWQSIRRYLLVLLLATLGGMIGSATTILALLNYN